MVCCPLPGCNCVKEYSYASLELRIISRFIPYSAQKESWPRGYKTFFMLDSVEYEILNAHKYKNIKKFVFFFKLR